MRDYFIVLPEGCDEKTYCQCMRILETASGCSPLERHHKEATYLVSDGVFKCIQWGDSRLEEYRESPEHYTELYLYMENV